ncbi:family 1 glycosylhydrolase [Eubacteriales bacterium OttesenSCG-928-N13]|nr:family 1 glycosylhydrolase [Eubacteriales bacterium OttesenSCG-928-N13]
MKFQQLRGMKLGAASASAQIEGGDVAHNWNEWADKGHIKDGSSPRRANDHFARWREDIDLMHDMGITIYRLSIEWARVEPDDNAFDEEAIEYYKTLLRYAREKGIEPLVTLHHFTHPIWFERRGGFMKKANIAIFLRYVQHVVRELGDLCHEYVTINEPNVFATMGYLGGGFPPGLSSILGAGRVMSVLAACHIQAYKLIHTTREQLGFRDTRVGFAHHMRVFRAQNPKSPFQRICTRVARHWFQNSVSSAYLIGHFGIPLRNYSGVRPGEYSDFLALNYYTTTVVGGLREGREPNSPRNDLDWEIYPEGIAECAKELYRLLPRPIYITENGTCDNEDAYRARYIAEHLEALLDSNLPVERYYHWCFTDNFEWLDGESARFGLVHVDYETQARTIKRSGAFYRDLIQEDAMTEALYQRYIKDQTYPT